MKFTKYRVLGMGLVGALDLILFQYNGQAENRIKK